MGKDSAIEWCHHTFNPWRGCMKVSAGCTHCYAETLSKRNPKTLGVWGLHGTRVAAAEAYWRHPVQWNTEAQQAGERRRVFCASLADVFEGEDTMPAASWAVVQQARGRLWELIEATPMLDWLLLTKRPQNASALATAWKTWPRNVWLGTSVENQATADERIPHLLNVPAAVRFLSCEPLLGPLELQRANPDPHYFRRSWLEYNQRVNDGAYNKHIYNRLDWVIVGGESGYGARPMHNTWARQLRDACVQARVAFHFKQHGEWIGMADYDPFTHGAFERHEQRGLWSTFPNDPENLPQLHMRVGKHAAGRLLDGVEWSEVPQ